MSQYPSWLGQDLINGTIAWDQAAKVELPTFLATYTLHDSYWIGLYLQPNQETVAVITWDTFWTQGRVPYPDPKTVTGPILLIRFERVYQTRIHYPGGTQEGWFTTIADATSERLLAEQREQMLELALRQPGELEQSNEHLFDETLHHTTIFAILGSQVDILHAAETYLLCLTSEREVLPIPDL